MERKKKRVLKNMAGIARLYIEAAKELGCEYDIISVPYIFRIIKGKKRWLFFGANTPLNSLSGGKIADNKHATKRVLKQIKIPLTQDFTLDQEDYKKVIREMEIYFPVVLKPLAGTIQGSGVITNIKSKKELHKMVKRLNNKGFMKLLVEEYLEGLNDFRVLVFKNKVVAATLRVPAYVIGDGKTRIRELIEEKNIEREKLYEIDMGEIKIDDDLKQCLKEQDLNLYSVPNLNKKIKLKSVCNLGQGGEGMDVTDDICDYNKNLAIKVAKALDLKLAGLDFLCKDISKPLKRRQGVIIEVNESPGFKLHQYPTVGKPRNIAKMIMKEIINN
ncbi:MAG: hypothetical protein ABH835_02255 [Patescibacteria group bacterium]|nr:hypothetical protein [Patescibacteria group bacterium]